MKLFVKHSEAKLEAGQKKSVILTIKITFAMDDVENLNRCSS